MFWGAKKKSLNFFKNISAAALKSYIKWLLYIFFLLKKFEKVEKTGIIATKDSLRCTPSVILGTTFILIYQNNTWTIRRLVDETIDPQQPSILY